MLAETVVSINETTGLRLAESSKLHHSSFIPVPTIDEKLRAIEICGAFQTN